MDSLYLLQFACFIFMLVNAFFVSLSHLHVNLPTMSVVHKCHYILVSLDYCMRFHSAFLLPIDGIA